MTVSEVAPYRSAVQPGHDGFAQLLRAEWTKIRTVRGWVVGLVLAALLTLALGVLTAVGGQITCQSSPTSPSLSGAACRKVPPLGPGGEPVSDSFYFVHQTLTGDGSITVRLTAITGSYSSQGAVQAGGSGTVSGTQPWSKAGIIIKQSSTQGSQYAAMTTTGGNGVRMQYNYTNDLAGEPGAPTASAPQWLRLTRSGDTVTGYDSTDGTRWTRVGTATLTGLPTSVQAGMFVASPDHVVTNQSLGSGTATGGPSTATGTFDDVALQGGWAGAGAGWTGTAMGGGGPLGQPVAQSEQFQQSGGTYTVTGSGDIAPGAGQGTGRPPELSLVGTFAGLIALIVVATMFITAEYRRGLIRLTLAASPGRGRVLAAKAVVVGAAAFAAGLVAALVTLPLGNRLSYDHGSYILPTSTMTNVRLIVGTAALFAVVAVLALAVGTLLRRSAPAVTVVIVIIVLPYILSVASVLPAGVAEWITRLSPAAAFSIQQSLIAYPQVTAYYSPADGYFPLAPFAGFAVLCGYTALALGLAAHRLRRRDA